MLLRVSLVITVVAIIFLSTNGETRENHVPGIFDGFTARSHKFPYHALIGCALAGGSVRECNGAIINNRFVATQASCVHDCIDYKIRVGSKQHPPPSNNVIPWITDLNANESYEYLRQPLTGPINAPGYVPGNKEHDLALLETNKQIIYYCNSVEEVILPNENSVAENVDVVASGFGGYHLYNPNWRLKYLTLNVLSNSNCSESFPNAGNDTICAQGVDYNGKIRGSLCDEYGAPLVLKEDNRTLVGIYQYSGEDCYIGTPAVFLKIAPYVSWIRKTARSDCINSNMYYL